MWFIINVIQFILIGVSTAVLATIGIFVTPISTSFPIWLARNVWSPLFLFICGAKLEIRGVEKIDTSQSCIFVANHISQADIPAVFITIPVNVYFIAKKELKKIPFVGWYIDAVGMIFIDRQNREKAFASLQMAASLIRHGRNVISFPEGTRSKTGEVGLFKRGTFVMAKESKVPVVPIAIKGTDTVWAPGTLKLRPGRISVQVGDPILPADFKDIGEDDFALQTQNYVTDMLNKM